MADSDNLAMPLLSAAQAQKHVTHNEALRVLDAVVQLSVKDRDLTAPPGSPAAGDRYIPAATATGDWAGQEGNIAAYQDGAWEFYTPGEGWLCWVDDEDILLTYGGSSWTSFFSLAPDGSAASPAYSFASDPDTGLYSGGANNLSFSVAGTGRMQLRTTGFQALLNGNASSCVYSWNGDIDTGMFRLGNDRLGFAAGGVNTFEVSATQTIVTSAAPLFTRAVDDIHITVNKEAAADDASFTYQTNFSTRALVGLLATDDYTIKVSPDGSTFYTAIVADKDNGAVTLTQGSKFKAYCNYRQYIAANTWTKVDTNNERWDKNNDYDTGTKRFDARIPGIHHFDAVIEHSVNGTVPTDIQLALYVNGVIVAYTTRMVSGTIIEGTTVEISQDLDLAGTEYVELYVYMTGQDGYVQADTNFLSGHYCP